MIDPITEAELHAFIDGQLDAARRIEVEARLARSPPLAARVMADMHARHMLRLAFHDSDDGASPAELYAARRLGRALGWRRVALRLRRLAACVLLIGFGWIAHSPGVVRVDDAPGRAAFVEEAVRPHETALTRHGCVWSRNATQRMLASSEAYRCLLSGLPLPI